MEKRVLANRMLYDKNISDGDYDYCIDSDIIGIVTKYDNDNKHYFVYNTDEIGLIIWEKELDSFEQALIYARKMYEGMLDMKSLMNPQEPSYSKNVEELSAEELEIEMCNNIQIIARIQLETIQSELEDFFKKQYRKEFVLDSRIKTPEKMLKKIELRRKNGREEYSPFDIPDIIGFRVSVDSEDEVIEVSKLIEQELDPIRKVDYLNNPKESGFKANLYYFLYGPTTVEIQVMTKEMKLWTNQTHDEYNKRTYSL